MNPLTKFASFLTLAGVLAMLFAVFPGSSPLTAPVEVAPTAEPGASNIPDNTRDPAPSEAVPSHSPTSEELSHPSVDPRVRVPAVRGASHYGWVQLPFGTHVELIRKDGSSLWVRWDGTVSRVSAQAARCGAVVLVEKGTANSKKG